MSSYRVQLARLGLRNLRTIYWDLSPQSLIVQAIRNGEGTLTNDGALVTNTGAHTGRSPHDRFIVRESQSEGDVWWGDTNKPLSPSHYERLYCKLCRHFAHRRAYVQNAFAGSDHNHRLGVRVITETAWHSLFAHNMFITPTEDEAHFFTPDYTVIHAPSFKADPTTDGTNSEAFVVINLASRLILIGGTAYAGEIKKSVFSVLNYLLPREGVLSMHCAANAGADGDTALFFGLSGTGKTTLSSDASRQLIGDDEHGWNDDGVFNVEGGCYAKVIRLSPINEPEIFEATRRYGTILENVVIDNAHRPDLNNALYTQNTRASYPITTIPNTKTDGRGTHPRNIVFLTADAFGVLPPVSRLTSEQAAYYFLNGYTAKVAGTERGVTEPKATFSVGFGEPFMPLNPLVYADLLRAKIREHGADVWLVNTGWQGGAYGVGQRISLPVTRMIINAILDGSLADAPYYQEPFFGLYIPTVHRTIPSAVFNPMWDDADAYARQARELAAMFQANAAKYAAVPV